ncbi:MAG: hypothetical protein IJV80_06660 [Clostridia bacterium]|nr:hypothetical protein [Clostridia bacterium]
MSLKGKKILFVTSSLFDEYNAARDIAYSTATALLSFGTDQVIVRYGGHDGLPTLVEEKCGFKSYFTQRRKLKSILTDKNVSAIQKIKTVFFGALLRVARIVRLQERLEVLLNARWLKKIIKAEKPSLVLFVSHPSKQTAKILKKIKIPYVVIHYDTTVEDPNVKMTKKRIAEEKYVMDNSEALFVQNCFYKGYRKYYTSDKLKPYNLPLLVDEEKVLTAYASKEKNYKFSYFGQLQAFRNGYRVNDIFEELGEKLFVFSTDKTNFGKAFEWSPAVTGQELYKTIAGSDYLVALDNSHPYEHYFPSKTCLYVSFTKPIIIFGESKKTALREFLAEYDNFYYQDINEPLDGLRQFLTKKQKGFDKKTYDQYRGYSAEQALKPIIAALEGSIN